MSLNATGVHFNQLVHLTIGPQRIFISLECWSAGPWSAGDKWAEIAHAVGVLFYGNQRSWQCLGAARGAEQIFQATQSHPMPLTPMYAHAAVDLTSAPVM